MDNSEKLKIISEQETRLDEFLIEKYKELENSPFYERNELPKYAGIYVFYEQDKPIYVGRTDNIRKRIQEHTSKGSRIGSAALAFNLAKNDFEKEVGKLKLKRNELNDNDKFKELFSKRKNYLFTCRFKCIELEHDILQTICEPFFAFKLGTYPINNTFENH